MWILSFPQVVNVENGKSYFCPLFCLDITSIFQGASGLALSHPLFGKLKFYEQALAITHEIGDRPLQRKILNIMGFTYKNKGREKPETALEYYKQALPIVRQVGDRALKEKVHKGNRCDRYYFYYFWAEKSRGDRRVGRMGRLYRKGRRRHPR
ncbi:MAG: tetratricopeptide repeat protein [Aulosira sp. DedQUE10]|nr:tetratricopeptide repeat protein [Aulosira sp. DedQUE10]